MGSLIKYHSVNIQQLKQFVYALFTQKPKTAGRRIQLAERNDMKNLMDRVELMANLSD